MALAMEARSFRHLDLRNLLGSHPATAISEKEITLITSTRVVILRPAYANLEFIDQFDGRLSGYESIESGIAAFNDHHYDIAFEHFKDASLKGVLEAKYLLGFMTASGIGCERDQALGMSLLHQAMRSGGKSAAHDLGLLYLTNNFPPKKQANFSGAMDCFRSYPNDPSFQCYLELSLREWQRHHTVDPSFGTFDDGCLLVQEPINSQSSSERPFIGPFRFVEHFKPVNIQRIKALIAGLKSYRNYNFGLAIDNFELALSTDVMAVEDMYLLAHLYLLTGKDLQKGIDFLSQAFDRGFKPAAFDLGLRYYLGLGISQNITRAKQIFESYSDDPKFKYHLGLALSRSLYAEHRARGLDLISRAAEEGYELAQEVFLR